MSTVNCSGRIEIYQVSTDTRVERLLRVFEARAKCTSSIATEVSNQFKVTIYAKCKNSPPKFISYRSTNLAYFTRDNFYPKTSVLGNSKLRGMCMFETGVLFVT